MEDMNLHLKTAEGQNEIVFRTGQAAPIVNPKVITIKNAVINSPGDFYAKRKELKLEDEQAIDKNKAIVFANISKSAWSITLETSPKCPIGGGNIIVGELKLSQELADSKVFYGVGNPHLFTRETMLRFIKFNPQFFPDQNSRNALFDSFQKLELTFTGGSKNESDGRGNNDHSFEKKVKTSLPETVKMQFEVFAGFPSAPFIIQLGIEHAENKTSFWFECAELVSYIQDKSETIIAEELKRFEDLLIIRHEA